MAQVSAKSTVRSLFTCCVLLLIGQSQATDTLIYESDSVKVMVTIDVTGLKRGMDQIMNATEFLQTSKDVRRYFFRNDSGKRHIIYALGKEVIQDAKLTNVLVGSLLNSSSNITYQVRSKRAWNLLGKVLHLTTGVVGPTQAKNMKKALSDLRGSVTALTHFNSQTVAGQKLEHAILSRTNSLIANLSDQVDDHMHRIRMNKQEGQAVVNLVSLLTSCNIMNKNIRSIVNRADKIISFGSLGYLSALAISRSTLSNVIRSIQLKNTKYSPLFGPNQINEYYTNKLTSVRFDGDYIQVALHVPLISPNERSTIRTLTKSQKELSYFDIFSLEFMTIDRRRNTYSLFSQSELDAMMHLQGQFVSRKRRAEIRMHQKICTEIQCDMAGVGDFVVRNIDDQSFLLKLKYPVTAILKCSDQTVKKAVNQSITLLTLASDCSLTSDHFEISASNPSQTEAVKSDIKFSLNSADPALVELAPEIETMKNETRRQHGWRRVIKENIADLRRLKSTNDKMEEMNSWIRNRVSNIEMYSLAGGGSLTIVLIIVIACACFMIITNRTNLTIPFMGRTI